MKISEVTSFLNQAETIQFQLPDGTIIPEHFHVTEVGVITKNFIDCGGTVREEKVANFQLWDANDFDHRLKPGKLLNIISLSEKVLHMGDLEVEVEYQSATIGKYGLETDGNQFLLTSKFTDCLASDSCGIPDEKRKVNINELSTTNSCTPGGGCC